MKTDQFQLEALRSRDRGALGLPVEGGRPPLPGGFLLGCWGGCLGQADHAHVSSTL